MNDPKPEPENRPRPAAERASETVPEIEELRAKLEAAERQAAENWDRYLRASAEVENVRRRAEREAAGLQKYALERLLSELITVNDSFQLGLKAAREKPEVEAIIEGMQLTHRQFWTLLERHGVTRIDPAGQPFDPEQHEAVSVVDSPDVPPNHVVTVMQTGYRLHDRLLRPAMVVVARAPAPGTEQDPPGRD